MKRWVFLWTVVVILIQPTPAFAPVRAYAEPKPVTHLVSPDIMAKWNLVAQCETQGHWYRRYEGWSAMSGGIGIRNYNWLAFGGYELFGAVNAGYATPEQQVFIARRIQASAGIPNYVPDQDGQCRGW